MRMRNNFFVEYGTYMLIYLASYTFALAQYHVLAGCLLLGEAIFLYIHWSRQAGTLVELRALFTLAWIGGQGISCMQLSKIQKDWHYLTWITFFLIYIGFSMGYDWGQRERKLERKGLRKNQSQAKKIFICSQGITILSILCFFIEMEKVGFVPIITNSSFSYSAFYVSGVHYGTFCCVLVPALSVLYIELLTSISWRRIIILLPSNVISIIIPYICGSRFQLLFAVGFAAVIYMIINKKIQIKRMAVLFGLLIVVYVLLTLSRNYDYEYLNGIFEMKQEHIPVILSQTYIYIANNYDNFNSLIEQLGDFTWGLRMLYPFFALSGMSLVFPQLTAFPIFQTKHELTTLTMFYDAYYDFGIIGSTLFAVILGILARLLILRLKENNNPVLYLFYGQIAIYFGLSFFTTWFSNPTTWAWLILTLIIYGIVGYDKKERK